MINIIVTDALKSYLEKKANKFITLGNVMSRTC